VLTLSRWVPDMSHAGGGRALPGWLPQRRAGQISARR
jgi:hypothetical protein